MIAFIIGLVLGLIYFGGLYLSIEMMTKVRYPGLIMGISFALRMAILLITFYFIAQRGVKDILLALAAVILVRIVMTFKLKDPSPNSAKKG